jgi:hypothetical protein
VCWSISARARGSLCYQIRATFQNARRPLSGIRGCQHIAKLRAHKQRHVANHAPGHVQTEQTLDSSQNQIQDEQNRVMLNRQQCTHNNSTNEVYTIIRYILASTYTTCVCFCCPLRNNSANKPERIHQLESNLPGNTHRCLVGHQVYETCTSGALPEA